MEFTITGNTPKTSNNILGYVDTTEEYALDDFCEEIFWELAEEKLGQKEADKLTCKIRYETQSFDEAFKYLEQWGYGLTYGIRG